MRGGMRKLHHPFQKGRGQGMTPHEFDCQTEVEILREQIRALNDARAIQSHTIVMQDARIARLEEVVKLNFPTIEDLTGPSTDE